MPLLAILLRLPFLDAPLTADEGGYAEVARLWARGESLYGSVWVDRPQGLLLVFRGLAGVGMSSTVGLRTAATVAGAALVLLAVALAWRTGGRIPAVICGVLVAAAGASPYIEGFTLCGELIASVAAAAALLAIAQHERSPRLVWLVAAGGLAGSALMVKQSAFDALLAIAAYLALRRRPRALAVFLGAAAVPVVAGVLGSGDPGAWADAIVGYGLHASAAAPVGERFHLLARSLAPAAKALGLVAVLAALSWRSSPLLARLWLVAAIAGVLVGGNFHPHYYEQLVVPLALVSSFVPLAARRGALLAVAVAAATVAFAVPLWGETDVGQARAIWPSDVHLRTDASVARFVALHTEPSQPIYVMWAAADLYYLADRRPAFRYLWLRNVETIHGAPAAVGRILRARTAALVVVEQPPRLVDPSGEVARALRQNYRLTRRVAGVPIYEPRR